VTNRATIGHMAGNPAGAVPRIPEGTFVQARHDGPLLPAEERQLMEGLLAGDDAAIRTLYARFGRSIYALGLRLLGSREAAEELTQDVFVMAWRKAARFDPARGRLSTWLMTIAHNLAVDRLRREQGVTRPRLVLVDEVPDAPGVDEEGMIMERDAAVRALSSLSDAEKRLLVRAYFRGMTAREIAETDGIPLGTVKTRLRAALIKVRKANEAKEQL
jgi:RNA polymerase sigma-70 factor, ECF subfamily